MKASTSSGARAPEAIVVGAMLILGSVSIPGAANAARGLQPKNSAPAVEKWRRATVRVNQPESTLTRVFAEISLQSAVSFTASREVADYPVICVAREIAAGSLVDGLVEVMRLRLDRDPSGYRVGLDPATREMLTRYTRTRDELKQRAEDEDEQLRLGWLRELKADDGKSPAASISGAFARSTAPEVPEFLKLLDDRTLESLAFGMGQPFGAIPSNGPGVMGSRLVGERKLADLPASLQSQITASGQRVRPDSRIGLALPGGVALSISDERGVRWLTPLGARPEKWSEMKERREQREARALQQFRAWEERGPDWMDPALREPALALRAEKRRALFSARSPSSGQLHMASQQWSEWADATRLPVVADGFGLSSFRILVHPEPPQRVTAARWARILADRFYRKYRVHKGILLLRGRHPLADRAAQPPPAVVAEAASRMQRSGRLPLLHLARLADVLSDEQLNVLRHLPEMREPAGRIAVRAITQHHLPLRLLGGHVPDTVPNDASSWSGPVVIKRPAQNKAWAFLTCTGETLRDVPPSAARRLTFNVGPNAATVDFVEGGARSSRHTIPLPAPMPVPPAPEKQRSPA